MILLKWERGEKKKNCLILAMVLLKNERGERIYLFIIIIIIIILHFGKIGGRGERKKIYLFVLLEFFLIFQKFIPLFYSTHI